MFYWLLVTYRVDTSIVLKSSRLGKMDMVESNSLLSSSWFISSFPNLPMFSRNLRDHIASKLLVRSASIVGLPFWLIFWPAVNQDHHLPWAFSGHSAGLINFISINLVELISTLNKLQFQYVLFFFIWLGEFYYLFIRSNSILGMYLIIGEFHH